MLLAICSEYTAGFDAMALRVHEIRFFYSGIRESLKRAATQRKELDRQRKAAEQQRSR